MATYSKSSFYYDTPVVNGYLDVASFRSIPPEADDIQFTITTNYENRPDLLAYDLYGDVNLWWVFAVRNPTVIKDPMYDMSAGTIIYLPKINSIKAALGI